MDHSQNEKIEYNTHSSFIRHTILSKKHKNVILHAHYLTDHINHKNLNESVSHHLIPKSTNKCKCKKVTEILGKNAQAFSNCLLFPLA